MRPLVGGLDLYYYLMIRSMIFAMDPDAMRKLNNSIVKGDRGRIYRNSTSCDMAMALQITDV